MQTNNPPYQGLGWTLARNWFLKWIVGVRGRKHLQVHNECKPFLVVANHPTFFDWAFEIAVMALLCNREFYILVDDRAGFLGEKLPSLMKQLRIVFLDPNLEGRLKNNFLQICNLMNEGWSIWIYPCGKENRLRKAHYSPAALACLTDCLIQPLYIHYHNVHLKPLQGRWTKLSNLLAGVQQITSIRHKIFITIGTPYSLNDPAIKERILKITGLTIEQITINLKLLLEGNGSLRSLVPCRQISEKIIVPSYTRLVIGANLEGFHPL